MKRLPTVGSLSLIRRPLRTVAVLAAAMVPCWIPATSRAGTEYYSGADNAGWTTTTSDWATSASGPYNTGWTSGNIAYFQGTGATVSVGSITADGMTFAATGYTLSGGTITLGGTTATITATDSATINSVLAGSAGLTTSGSGVLTLGGANTYTGATTVGIGSTLAMSQGSALGSTAVSVSVASTFAPTPTSGGTITGGTSLSLANGSVFKMIGTSAATDYGTYSNRGAVTFSGATLDFTLGALSDGGAAIHDELTDTGAATVSGTNTIDITGIGSYYGVSTTSTTLIPLITAASGLTIADFKLGTTSLVLDGATYTLSLVTNPSGPTGSQVDLSMTVRPPVSP